MHHITKFSLFTEIMINHCGYHYPEEITYNIIQILIRLDEIKISCNGYDTWYVVGNNVWHYYLLEQRNTENHPHKYGSLDDCTTFLKHYALGAALNGVMIKKIIDKFGKLFLLGYNGCLYGHRNKSTDTTVLDYEILVTDVKYISRYYHSYLVIVKYNDDIYRCWYDGDSWIMRGEQPLKMTTTTWDDIVGIASVSFAPDTLCGHTLIVTDQMILYSSGNNSNGQLGIGTAKCVSNFEKVPIMGVKDAAVGNNHSITLKHDGQVITWGCNFHGQLGIGADVLYSEIPMTIESLPPIRSIACGKRHCLALSYEGVVYTWGHNDHGKLGYHLDKHELMTSYIPRKLDLPPITQITCGDDYSVAVTITGDVFVWGRIYNNDGVPQKLRLW